MIRVRISLKQFRSRVTSLTMLAVTATSLITLSLGSVASAQAASARMALFNSAAQEFGVPASVLLAISYNQTHWESSSQASVDGGFGLMDLRAYQATAVSGRDGRTVVSERKQADSYYTLDQAATLLKVSADTLKTDDAQNIRGGAAVLAQAARHLNNGQQPANVNDWYTAVATYSGATTVTAATRFADDVYATIKTGASLTTSDGQSLNLSALRSVAPNKDGLSALGLRTNPPTNSQETGQTPECPSTLDCSFVPAAYAQDDPNDPSNYGNYDPANRPSDMAIKYIFIHDTEGSYDSAIAHFQDPTSYVSAQYVVRSSDGAITQMVRNGDVSWGVFDWYDNMHGINIENEGFAAQGAQWYTPVMYQKLATLVRYLAIKYHIPMDRQHILGHDNIPVLHASSFQYQHWDPGPFWNWDYFMNLVHGESPTEASNFNLTDVTNLEPLRKGDIVTIAPRFSTNQQPVTDCKTGTCVTLPAQGTSFVYLRTQPSDTAPLLNDSYAHPGSTVGTTNDSDWGDKAPSGFSYVVADVSGDWTEIYFAGRIGWFYNPAKDPTAHKSHGLVVVPKSGISSVAVYGAAYPEASAYPADVPVQTFDALYAIPGGQSYTTTGEDLPTDYFYDATINFSLPDDHMIVRGKQKYYQITVNHRIGYVKADDVTVQVR